MYVVILPNLSDKNPLHNTPIKVPVKKMICPTLLRWRREQTKSKRTVAVSLQYNVKMSKC